MASPICISSLIQKACHIEPAICTSTRRTNPSFRHCPQKPPCTNLLCTVMVLVFFCIPSLRGKKKKLYPFHSLYFFALYPFHQCFFWSCFDSLLRRNFERSAPTVVRVPPRINCLHNGDSTRFLLIFIEILYMYRQTKCAEPDITTDAKQTAKEPCRQYQTYRHPRSRRSFRQTLVFAGVCVPSDRFATTAIPSTTNSMAYRDLTLSLGRSINWCSSWV